MPIITVTTPTIINRNEIIEFSILVTDSDNTSLNSTTWIRDIFFEEQFNGSTIDSDTISINEISTSATAVYRCHNEKADKLLVTVTYGDDGFVFKKYFQIFPPKPPIDTTGLLFIAVIAIISAFFVIRWWKVRTW